MNVTFNLSITHSRAQSPSWVVKPASAPGAQVTARKRALVSSARPDGDIFTALVVERDDRDRAMLRCLLERQNFVVYEANAGPQALGLAERFNPDIMLMDLAIPGSGPAFLRALRSMHDRETLPVIVLAQCDRFGAVEECLAAGANDFVVKPVEWPELYLRILAHLPAASQRSRRTTGMVRELWA